MWKVLIADDEPKIRRGLRSLLEKLDSSLEVVAEAEDGEAAYELALTTNPDILFIDIRMPFMDGLELIQRLSEYSNQWIIIIVTGHDEFDYARRAISLQVFEYLLKPVDPEVLKKTLDLAKQELSLRRETNRYISWARNQLEQNRDSLREAFLRDLVEGKLSRTDVGEGCRFLGIQFPQHPAILLVQVEERIMSVGTIQIGYRRLMMYAVKAIVEEFLGRGALVFIDGQENVVAITEGPEESLTARLPSLEAAIYEATHQRPLLVLVSGSPLERSFHSNGNGASSATLHGEDTYPYSQLQELYEEAQEELEKKLSTQPLVLLAQNYIERNYPYPELSLEETAQELEVSPGYLSRLLKRATGYSFVEYLCRVRIKHALQLMENPALKIYEIAEQVGYRSQHYFSRAFKQVLGISPIEYKNRGGSSRSVTTKEEPEV
ncbi:MAG TPA: response regulator [Termitinemataceae bacterium]|nr:response regulator [Termitinemataceae bacterium]HOM23401.1 response regulator [Termitinemataceae bacterium]HPQ01264.1 response regulator [Termitinemataceae bacterium]